MPCSFSLLALLFSYRIYKFWEWRRHYKTRGVKYKTRHRRPYCLRLATPRNPLGLCRKKRSAGEKPGGIPLRNPYCLSVASLRILGISPGFSAFGGLGPRPFVTFVAMTKVKPLSSYSIDSTLSQRNALAVFFKPIKLIGRYLRYLVVSPGGGWFGSRHP